MAYTYDQFTKAATEAGMLEKFSQLDLDTAKSNPEYGLSMLKLYQDEAGATTAEQKLLAQEAANQLRKTYGTLNTANQTVAQQGSSFDYQNQTAYQDVLDKIVNRQPFEYNQNEDPQYSAFRKAYLREADRAREDTLAKVSANSGGTPSSFAVTAAQQAGDYYVGQLNDQLPTLQQNAYQRYLNEISSDISTLEALANDRSFNYSAYLQEQEKLAQAAELMAGKGDYSRLAALLGLTDAELAVLTGQSGYTGEYSGDDGGGIVIDDAYDNEDVSEGAVKNMQIALGLEPTGKWDAASVAAAGGMGAGAAWAAYNKGQLGKPVGVTADWMNGQYTGGAGISGSAMTNHSNYIDGLLKAGRYKEAEDFLAVLNQGGKLSTDQQKQLISIFGKYTG